MRLRRTLSFALLTCSLGALSFVAASPALATPKAKSTVAAFVPNDALYSQVAWSATNIELPQAWALTLGRPGVTIAILDTGVTPVADLAGALVPGYNFVAGNTDTTDDNGHGTEVASIAAARVNNRIGIAGVCGRCSIMPVKVLDSKGVGSPATIAQGVAWAVSHGAQIINISAATKEDSRVLDAAIAAAIEQGVTVVIAAGNSGSSSAAGSFPASASPQAIRVAGLDAQNKLFGWSNRGAWVDIAAPGSTSAALTNGTYFLGVQGTSVAAPIVAGVAGLMLSANGTLDPAAIKSMIQSTGTRLPGLGIAGGRGIDAYAAVSAASAAI